MYFVSPDEQEGTLHVTHLSQEVSCTECHFAAEERQLFRLWATGRIPDHTATGVNGRSVH